LKDIGCSDATNSNEFDTEVVDSKLGFELSGSYEEKVSKLTEDAKKMIPLDLTNPDKLVANIKGFATVLIVKFFSPHLLIKYSKEKIKYNNQK